MSETNKVPNFLIVAKELKQNTIRMAGTEAQKFFRDCFVKGGWTDTSFQKWTDGKSPLKGKKTLYRDGNLMMSVRKLEESDSQIVTGSDAAYADIHNSGGTITVTSQMKKFWWAQYYKFAGKVQTTKGGKASRSKSNQTISVKAEFCKRMAMMKVGSKIKIPKRQFIGESQTLMKQFEDWLEKEIETKFKTDL